MATTTGHVMGIFRRARNPNTFVGIILLIVLAVFAGPNALPRVLSSIVPIADEGAPCDWMRASSDRNAHQSVLGRIASEGDSPLSIRVDAGTIPASNDGTLVIRIIFANETIGTVPFVYPGAVDRSNNSAVNGIGVVFSNVAVAPSTNNQPVPESNIRLLGPRQRCVARIELTVPEITQLGITPASVVKAYYRNGSNNVLNGGGELIFANAGLWTGVIESGTETFTLASSNP